MTWVMLVTSDAWSWTHLPSVELAQEAPSCCDELPAYQEIGQRVPSAIDHNDLSKPIVTPALGGLPVACVLVAGARRRSRSQPVNHDAMQIDDPVKPSTASHDSLGSLIAPFSSIPRPVHPRDGSRHFSPLLLAL